MPVRGDHKLALGQMSHRCNDILEQLPEQALVIGAVASDAQIKWVSHEIRAHCRNKGIEILYTAGYTPSMNSIPERASY